MAACFKLYTKREGIFSTWIFGKKRWNIIKIIANYTQPAGKFYSASKTNCCKPVLIKWIIVSVYAFAYKISVNIAW